MEGGRHREREKEGTGERERGFVRVARRIRQSRGCTRRIVARAVAASAPPATTPRHRIGYHTHTLVGIPAGPWTRLDHCRSTRTRVSHTQHSRIRFAPDRTCTGAERHEQRNEESKKTEGKRRKKKEEDPPP